MIGVDSNVIIDILRNKNLNIKLSEFSSEGLCTSEIVVYEILYGFFASKHFSEKRFMEFEAVLDTFVYVFPVDRRATVAAAKIAGGLSMTGKSIGHSDALIAGSLMANGCNKFLTNNAKDFENIKELEVINPLIADE